MRVIPRADADRRGIQVAMTLMGLAIIGVLVAVVAWVVLLLAMPEAGSTLEATLGRSVAVGGLSAAVFSIASVIYVQVKNLWRFVPSWLRIAVVALAIVGLLITTVSGIQSSAGQQSSHGQAQGGQPVLPPVR